MITTIYSIVLFAIFVTCIIVIFRKTKPPILSKECELYIEELESEVGYLEMRLNLRCKQRKELDAKIKAQSARIAELIELCNKLQPDLVGVKSFGEDNTYPNALRFMQECYHVPHDIPFDGKVWIDECNKVDFSQLDALVKSRKEKEEWGQRFENAKKFYKATTGKDIEDLKKERRFKIDESEESEKAYVDWFEELKDGEPFYYYYTFGKRVLAGYKPLCYKCDGGMFLPRKTKEEAERDMKFCESCNIELRETNE